MHYVVSEMGRKCKPHKCTGKNCSETQALGYGRVWPLWCDLVGWCRKYDWHLPPRTTMLSSETAGQHSRRNQSLEVLSGHCPRPTKLSGLWYVLWTHPNQAQWAEDGRFAISQERWTSFFFFLIKKKNVLAMLCSIQDLSSLTRDWTPAICSGSMES